MKNHLKKLLVTSISVGILGFSQSTIAASVGYVFDRSFGTASGRGTITTDGTLGNIVVGEAGRDINSFFVDWNINLTVGTDSFTLTPANSSWEPARGIINATPNKLRLNLALTSPPPSPGSDSGFQLAGGFCDFCTGTNTTAVYSWQFVPTNANPLSRVSEQIRVFNSLAVNPNPPRSYILKEVPEPITVVGSGVALGFGIFFKRQLNKKK